MSEPTLDITFTEEQIAEYKRLKAADEQAQSILEDAKAIALKTYNALDDYQQKTCYFFCGRINDSDYRPYRFACFIIKPDTDITGPIRKENSISKYDAIFLNELTDIRQMTGPEFYRLLDHMQSGKEWWQS